MSIRHGRVIDRMGEPGRGATNTPPSPALDRHSDETGRRPDVHPKHGAPMRARYILPALTHTGAR
jgi:hypothetical protein